MEHPHGNPLGFLLQRQQPSITINVSKGDNSLRSALSGGEEGPSIQEMFALLIKKIEEGNKNTRDQLTSHHPGAGGFD